MLLKRVYDESGGAPRCIGVQLKHTGIHAEQNFSSRLVTQGLAEGWIRLEPDALIVKTDVAELRYAIKRTPGYYCAYDGARIPISDMATGERLRTGIGRLAAAEARAYLALHGFAGMPSPDQNHPAGYQVLDHFECVLDSAQHARYRAKSGALAPSMQAKRG